MGTGLGTALTAVWGYIGDAISFANDNPVVWAGAAFGIAGAAIGLLKRAVRVGGRRR